MGKAPLNCKVFGCLYGNFLAFMAERKLAKIGSIKL